jgi:hypothetical protein
MVNLLSYFRRAVICFITIEQDGALRARTIVGSNLRLMDEEKVSET